MHSDCNMSAEYARGFLTKCAELHVDPAAIDPALVKLAQDADAAQDPREPSEDVREPSEAEMDAMSDTELIAFLRSELRKVSPDQRDAFVWLDAISDAIEDRDYEVEVNGTQVTTEKDAAIKKRRRDDDESPRRAVARGAARGAGAGAILGAGAGAVGGGILAHSMSKAQGRRITAEELFRLMGLGTVGGALTGAASGALHGGVARGALRGSDKEDESLPESMGRGAMLGAGAGAALGAGAGMANATATTLGWMRRNPQAKVDILKKLLPYYLGNITGGALAGAGGGAVSGAVLRSAME